MIPGRHTNRLLAMLPTAAGFDFEQAVPVLPQVRTVGDVAQVHVDCEGLEGAHFDALRMSAVELRASNRIKEVVYFWNCPGGMVSGASEAAESIYRLATTKKTTSLVSGGMCCSAAYWLAAATGQIVATPTSDIGSLGVRMDFLDVTDAMESQGLKTVSFDTSKFKSIGLPGRRITEADVSRIQQYIEESKKMFFDALLKYKRGTAKQLKTAFDDGGVWHATEAKRLGLVDQVIAMPEDFLDTITARSNVRTDRQNQLAANAKGVANKPKRIAPAKNQFDNLDGEDAYEKYVDLVTAEAGEDVITPEPEHVEIVEKKYPRLVAKVDAWRLTVSDRHFLL